MDEPSMDWDIEEYSSEANSSKVNWLWNKGVAIGKKVLVTGMVISSAPFVLPPLLVVSALGIAVSVPYGLIFASYACSEKLMSRLLPNPYEEGIGEEEEEEVGFGGDIDMEEEKVEQTEDIKEQLKTRFELVEGNEEEKTMVGDTYGNRGMVEDLNSEVREIMEKDNDIIEGSLSQQPRDEMRGVLLTLEVDENDGSKFDQIRAPFEVTNVVVLESGRLQDIGEDELVRETRGLIETFSDEGKPHNPVEEEKMQPEGMHEADDEIDVVVESKNYGKKGKRKGRKKEKAEEKTIEKLPRETDVHKIKQSGNAHADQDKKLAGLVEEKKPITEESEKMTADYGKEKTSNKVDAGKMLKQGTSKGNDQENSLGIGDAKIPISLASSGLNDGRGLQILAGRGISPSFVEDEEIYGEEKIWQQIEAMRKIVGYKAKLQASCIEELKALYLFTGVEPPGSFKDTLDVVELNNKLRFLMSVVGVK
ncbi:neurofilament medium polypeptide-like isoform X2 [Rhodamnia argentea]|uniref:Neurofilament medium polypeptide-like isoform X2 n=1 Tax=Rhodamnia argentea TaxID=178133 RepID=A0A8B8P470_9MYRT|nr:neurofilament medium polypeptide-like isoform X2 [Rhodamnia argentea]